MIDADTLAVVDTAGTEERVRIIGVDTPEIGRAGIPGDCFGGGVVLSAENRRQPDIETAELSDLRVWGVVTRSLHRVLKG